MKKFISLILFAAMLLSVGISASSCANNYDDIKKDLYELKDEGEISDILEGTDDEFISMFLESLGINYAKRALYAFKGSSPAPKEADGCLSVLEFKNKTDAKDAYERIMMLDGNDDFAYIKRKGLVVIYGDKDFCEKIF